MQEVQVVEEMFRRGAEVEEVVVVVVVVVVIAYYYSARVLRAKFLCPTR